MTQKRPKLPGAAEFFAISEAALGREEAPQDDGPGVPVNAAISRQEEAATRHRGDQAPRTEAQWAAPLTIAEGPTEKVTFYVHPMLLKRLELLKAQLLVEHNLKVTRSQIIEYLLEDGLSKQETVIAALLERAE